MFRLVAGQQLSEACQLAHTKGDHRLALLLSQATQNTDVNRYFYAHISAYFTAHYNFRVYIRKQLVEWKNYGTDHYIDSERLKLYVLLAGELVWEPSVDRRREGPGTTRRVVRVCEDLDWKRALALHLCYTTPPSSTIASAVSRYLKSFKVKT